MNGPTDRLAAHNPVPVSGLGDSASTPEATALLERILSDPPTVPPRSRRTRLPVRLRLGLVGPLASGAAVALVAVLANSGGAPPPRPPSASEVLLAAAARTEKAPVVAGRYWHTRVRKMTPTKLNVGDKNINYQAMCDSDVWAARESSDQSWWVVASQQTRPLTVADERLWRARGNPELGYCSYGHGSEVGSQGFAAPYAVKLSTSGRSAPYAGYPTANGKTISFRAIERLPADPAELKKILARWSLEPPPSPSDDASKFFSQYVLFTEAADLLFDLPTTPQVRAALYRMLASLESVRVLGTVRDPLGRTGQGIALPNCRFGGNTDQLILDQRTGQLLAIRQVQGCDSSSQVREWSALLESGWTDQSPRLPKERADF